MTDIDRLEPRRLAALKGWARRRLNAYLSDYERYMGKKPKSITLWAEDFDLLNGDDDRVELKRGRDRL